MKDLAETLARVAQRGFTEAFDASDGRLHSRRGMHEIEDVAVKDTLFIDTGTDPGDDVTIYLLSTASGMQGYLVMPGSPHIDPAKAQFIDRLIESRWAP
jgi:hypothetical protein